MKRPLCKNCNAKPRAYAYRRDTKIYWRSLCDTCIRKKNQQKVSGVAKWQLAGYKKKIDVSCVVLKQQCVSSWMCTTWMEIATM